MTAIEETESERYERERKESNERYERERKEERKMADVRRQEEHDEYNRERGDG